MRLVLLLSVILFSGCKSYWVNRYCPSTGSTRTLIYKDSVELIQPFNFKFEASNPCDSSGRLKPFIIENKGSRGRAIVYSDSNKLKVECDCDSILNVYKERYDSSTKVIAVPSKGDTITFRDRMIINTKFFWWIGILTVIYFCYRLAKLLPKPF